MHYARIIGNGVFGKFLRDRFFQSHSSSAGYQHFYEPLSDPFKSLILAVPADAYEEVAAKYKGFHLVNICSIQSKTTEILKKYSENVTSIHPLFGPNTPNEKRFSILTYRSFSSEENSFLDTFAKISRIEGGVSPEDHDRIMAKTHYVALKAAQELKGVVDEAKNIPDVLIPNSFRLLRNFVETVGDIAPGTINSILANPFIKK